MRRLLALLMVLSGCGGVVESGGDAAPNVATDAAAPSGVDCTRSCAARTARARTEGFCDPLLVGGDGGFVDCAAACREVAARSTFSDQVRLAGCLETDPLCFQTLEQCMGR